MTALKKFQLKIIKNYEIIDNILLQKHLKMLNYYKF